MSRGGLSRNNELMFNRGTSKDDPKAQTQRAQTPAEGVPDSIAAEEGSGTVLRDRSQEPPKKKTAEKAKKAKSKDSNQADRVKEGEEKNGLVVKGAVAEAKKKPSEDKLNIDFDDQSFLWDHIDEFKNVKQNLTPLPPNPKATDLSEESFRERIVENPILYKNFLQIQDDEPLTTTNKLFALGIDALNGATTAQLSSIVPYMKLFKVLPQQPNVGGKSNRKKIEFPFNKYTTMESILESRENRGTDVGLKSVDWEDLGGNPGNTGLAFKGTFTLHFQSFEGIFKTRRVDGEDIRFADIMVLESLTGRSAKKNPASTAKERANDTNVNCNTTTQIYMECGYTLPPRGIAGDPTLSKELEKLRRTYIITPIDQDINITNNGAVDMTITFCAALEGRTFGAASDILNIGDVSQRQLIKAKKQEMREKRSAKRAASKNDLKKQREEYKELKKELNSLKEDLRSIQYQRLLTVIRNGISRQSAATSRVFHVDIDTILMERYREYLQDSAESYEESKKETREEKQARIEEFQAARKSYMAEINSRTDLTQVRAGGNIDALGVENPKERNMMAGKYRLHYVYLGDIVEAVMTILYQNPKISENKIVSKKPTCPDIKSDVRVLMGSFSFMDPATGGIKNIQLADVPVSFNYFNSWWYDNVIKKKLSHYPLRAFLRDLCGKLLNNVMSPKRYGGMPGRRTRIAVQSVWTRKTTPSRCRMGQLWGLWEEAHKCAENIHHQREG